MKYIILIALSLEFHTHLAFAQKKPTANKGILNEIKSNTNNEEKNEKASLAGEVLITKTENQAIASLEKLLAKYKGKPEEARLQYHLAELYMRRAKSGRFFDLYKDSDSKIMKMAPPFVKNESATQSLRKAVATYNLITEKFPKFDDMDAVLFNKAFAEQQLNLLNLATHTYKQLIEGEKYKNSPLIPDALLALGEIYYDQQNFADAFTYFDKIENYKESRVYVYGMYKSSWALYNLKKNNQAIEKLKEVIKYHDGIDKAKFNLKHDLRKEALNDLTLFYSDTFGVEDFYKFITEITTNKEEAGEYVMVLSKIVLAHGKNKENINLLKGFISKDDEHSQKVNAIINIAETYEIIKDREPVIDYYNLVYDECLEKSDWYKKNKENEAAKKSCAESFPNSLLETTEYWWEVTQKNKEHKKINELTEKIFRLYIKQDSIKTPDTKTRFAFAEFLFQQKKFREASENYEFAAKKTSDKTLKHDALFASIFSMDNARENKDFKPEDLDKAKELIEIYLTEYKTDKHFFPLTLKKALINYEQKKYPEAESIAKSLLLEKKHDLKEKAEDLLLEIYNVQKRYKDISLSADQIMKSNPKADRLKKMQSIQKQAEYNQIVDTLNTGNKSVAANQMLEYSERFKGDPLAVQSWIDAISLLYAGVDPLRGAGEADKFFKNNPKHEKNKSFLLESIKVHSEIGDLSSSARNLEKLAEIDPAQKENYIETAIDSYLMEGNDTKAKDLIQKSLKNTKKDKRHEYITRLYGIAQSKNNAADIKELEKQIISENIEPLASEIAIKKIYRMYDDKKYADVFNASKKLVSSGYNAEIKAKARLLQAKVLERELVTQSVKSKIDKLNIVLSLKTEKLDKAQSAYLDAVRLSQTPEIQFEALTGLSKIYNNYINDVQNVKITEEITPEDDAALKTELAKIVEPIETKLFEIDEKLKLFNGSPSEDTQVDFATLKETETVPTKTPQFNFENLPTYLTFNFKDILVHEKHILCTKTQALEAQFTETYIKQILSCLNANKLTESNDLTYKLISKDAKSPLGFYILSITSEKLNLLEKSLWVIEKAILIDPKNSWLHYQKAKLLYKQGNHQLAYEAMGKAAKGDKMIPAQEIKIYSAIDFIKNKKPKEAYKILDSFETTDLIKLDLLAPYTEVLGQLDKASTAASLLEKHAKKSADLYQLARVYELYLKDLKKSKAVYEKIKAQNPPANEFMWLDSKTKKL